MPAGTKPAPSPTAPGAALLEAREVSVRYRPRGRARGRPLDAVRAVSLALAPGQTLALVGESGAGKSSLGRALLALDDPGAHRSGAVWYRPGAAEGAGPEAPPPVNLLALSPRALRPWRRDLQVVFQDPYASLDPRMTVGQTLAEPLVIHGLARGRQALERAAALLPRVGLAPAFAARFPGALSGGERQRVAIARALALEPRVLVCDEPLSALDVSVQAQILNLLTDLQEDRREQGGLAILLIAHDLAVVRHAAHRVAVMREGRIVEEGPTEAVFSSPRHAYTRALLDAVPRLPAGSP